MWSGQAKFTTKELRELGELANADVIVDPAELELDDASREKVANDPVVRRNLDVLRAWAARPPTGRPRRVHVRFYRRPVEVFGDVHVTALRLERTRLDPGGNATGTDEMCTLDAQMVLRSVGYRGLPVVDLPFDEQAGVIPNTSGRVLRGGVPVPGEYVAVTGITFVRSDPLHSRLPRSAIQTRWFTRLPNAVSAS